MVRVQKVCLGKRGLGGHWNWQEAKDLRESMLLQSDCLKESYMTDFTKNITVCKQNSNMPTPKHKTICCKWAHCLEKAGAVHFWFSVLCLCEAEQTCEQVVWVP